VSLGLKQLGADPWENISRRYPPHTRCSARSRTLPTTARSSKIEDGVEGLVHVSEMGLDQQERQSPRRWCTPARKSVMVLDVDEERRRISLGLKQCKANP